MLKASSAMLTVFQVAVCIAAMWGVQFMVRGGSLGAWWYAIVPLAALGLIAVQRGQPLRFPPLLFADRVLNVLTWCALLGGAIAAIRILLEVFVLSLVIAYLAPRLRLLDEAVVPYVEGLSLRLAWVCGLLALSIIAIYPVLIWGWPVPS